jgi:hypothetical protein
MSFVKATRKKAKARIAIEGPSGSGKTYTALLWAKTLGSKIALIDSERSSSCLYDNIVDFDVSLLETFSPADYVREIELAASAGYDVLVIDSLTHAWSGKGGALEMVDQAAKRSKSANSFAAWREVTPEHDRLVTAILNFPGHVICTLRVKSEYVLEKDEKGRTVPRRIGLAPIQRDGLEYEFTVVCEMDIDHNLVVTKSRFSGLSGQVFHNPSGDHIKPFHAWLSEGAEDPVGALQKDIALAESDTALNAYVAQATKLKPTLSKQQGQLLAEAITRAKERITQQVKAALEDLAGKTEEEPNFNPQFVRDDVKALADIFKTVRSKPEYSAALSDYKELWEASPWDSHNTNYLKQYMDGARETYLTNEERQKEKAA